MRAIRGAICAEANTREAIYRATQTLLREMTERNRLDRASIVSVFFTMTPDLDAEYPAYAARDMGWTDVPMLGAVETPVPGALTRVIRVLILAEGDARPRHVYLGRAARMRPELAEPGDEEMWNGAAPRSAAPGPAFGEPPAARSGRRSLGVLSVLGLGLIGGSVAAAARASGRFDAILGHDPNAAAAATARARGWLDETLDPEPAVRRADIVVLAAPLRELPALVRRAAAWARPGTLLTDVGSLKRPVVRAMDGLPDGVRAVGGHPMAGTERAGAEAADPALLRGAPWALVPSRRTDDEALARARELARALGARPVVLDADAHDRAVAVTSHLPLLAALALAQTAAEAARREPAVHALIGPGFRGATRLAAGPPALAADLLGGQPAEVADALERFARELDRLAALARDPTALGRAAAEIRAALRALLEPPIPEE